jgi:hypothetical protein
MSVMRYTSGLVVGLRENNYYVKEYGNLMLETLELVSGGGIILYRTSIVIMLAGKIFGPKFAIKIPLGHH